MVASLLIPPTVPCSLAQQTRKSSRPVVDWNTLIPGIKSALESELRNCADQRAWIEIVDTGDVTGDGIPEALVEYCHMGAYTSNVALMRLDEHGKPVLAKLRDKDGKAIVVGSFLRGASVRNGTGTELLPEKHAVYAIYWGTDDSGALQSCGVDAYKWVAKTGTFDADEALSKEIAESECNRLKQELSPSAAPQSD